jgi:predicted ATPase
MHLKGLALDQEKFPTLEHYPFHLKIFQQTKRLEFTSNITFFIGENGTGKSTLLKALSTKCGIHMWEGFQRSRYENNPYEKELYKVFEIEWTDGQVSGSYFASQTFQNFTQILDEWATMDPGVLSYFGGKSLMTQSHGQSLLAFFRSRYQRKGLYLLDEPETALSPKSQIELLNLIIKMCKDGHAQFIIATHSPILLSCPEAKIFSFNSIPAAEIEYEDTEYYQIYHDFLNNREKYFA